MQPSDIKVQDFGLEDLWRTGDVLEQAVELVLDLAARARDERLHHTSVFSQLDGTVVIEHSVVDTIS